MSFRREGPQLSLLSPGKVWKHHDEGRGCGTAWESRSFQPGRLPVDGEGSKVAQLPWYRQGTQGPQARSPNTTAMGPASLTSRPPVSGGLMLLGKIRHGDSAGHLALDLEMTQRWGGGGEEGRKTTGSPRATPALSTERAGPAPLLNLEHLQVQPKFSSLSCLSSS